MAIPGPLSIVVEWFGNDCDKVLPTACCFVELPAVSDVYSQHSNIPNTSQCGNCQSRRETVELARCSSVSERGGGRGKSVNDRERSQGKLLWCAHSGAFFWNFPPFHLTFLTLFHARRRGESEKCKGEREMEEKKSEGWKGGDAKMKDRGRD